MGIARWFRPRRDKTGGKPFGRGRFAFVLVLGVLAAVLVASGASAFPENCNGTACSGTATYSFPSSQVCQPGTATYWEDSYLPADAQNPTLTNFTVSPDPPCTGATVSGATVQPFPATGNDPNGSPPSPPAGKATFRFTWTVYVPTGSTPINAMRVSWTIDWTEPQGSTSTTTSTTGTPAVPCQAKLKVMKTLDGRHRGYEVQDRHIIFGTFEGAAGAHYTIAVKNVSECVAEGVVVGDDLRFHFDCTQAQYRVYAKGDEAGPDVPLACHGEGAHVTVDVGDLAPGEAAYVYLHGTFKRKSSLAINTAHAGAQNAAGESGSAGVIVFETKADFQTWDRKHRSR